MTTTARTVNDIAAIIRDYDPDGITLAPSDLANRIAVELRRRGLVSTEEQENAIEDFAYDCMGRPGVGQRKLIMAQSLAELIVAEFNLDAD